MALVVGFGFVVVVVDVDVVVDVSPLNKTRRSSSYSSPNDIGITELSRCNESDPDGDIDNEDDVE